VIKKVLTKKVKQDTPDLTQLQAPNQHKRTTQRKVMEQAKAQLNSRVRVASILGSDTDLNLTMCQVLGKMVSLSSLIHKVIPKTGIPLSAF
jgi:hypothetical protein